MQGINGNDSRGWREEEEEALCRYTFFSSKVDQNEDELQPYCVFCGKYRNSNLFHKFPILPLNIRKWPQIKVCEI